MNNLTCKYQCMIILHFLCLLINWWWKLEADLLKQFTFPWRSFKWIFRFPFSLHVIPLMTGKKQSKQANSSKSRLNKSYGNPWQRNVICTSSASVQIRHLSSHQVWQKKGTKMHGWAGISLKILLFAKMGFTICFPCSKLRTCIYLVWNWKMEPQ